ncbi:MAG: hypothetical protein ACOYLG_01090 [Chitinophagaceae bacterium]
MQPSSKKYPLIWPLLIILLLIGGGYFFSKKKSNLESEELASSNDQAEKAIGYPTLFTPKEIITMVNQNEDYISGECINKKFYVKNSENENYKLYANSVTSYDRDIYHEERMFTWSDSIKRLVYSFPNKEKYQYFIAELNKLHPTILSIELKDNWFKDSTSYLVDNCVFVLAGNKIRFSGYTVLAINQEYLNKRTASVPPKVIKVVSNDVKIPNESEKVEEPKTQNSELNIDENEISVEPVK